MRHVFMAILLLLYIFVVGHFNFAIALATGAVLFTAYRRHAGDLDKWFSADGS